MKNNIFIISLIVCFFISGCGANKMVVSQNFSTRIIEIKKIGVILSDVSVQEVSVGGAKSYMAQETAFAMPIVGKVAVESAKALKINAKLLSFNNELRKITGPFNKISVEELHRIASDTRSEPVMEEFGPLAKKTGVDAFLLFRSCENESSGGRKALKTLNFLAMLAGGPGAVPTGESTFADISLVDKKGHLLYYNSTLSSNTLRDEKDVKNIFKELMEDLYAEKAKI